MESITSFNHQVIGFTQYLKKEEYKPETIKVYSKKIQAFLEWKKARCKNCYKESLDILIFEYLNFFNQKKNFKTIRATINKYYYYLTGEKLKPAKDFESNESIEAEIESYINYLEKVAGFSKATRIAHRRYLKRFLYYLFPKCKLDPVTISVDSVQSFFNMEIQHLIPASKKAVIGIIRSYIRYLKFSGVVVDPGLLLLPLSAPVWKLSSVPKTFDKKDIEKIHASYDLSTFTGIRDYAIAQCFTELGLRVSEVANIALDDINWRESKIKIKKTKTHMERELPISHQVGDAIFNYLKKARPVTDDRTLFVRFSHFCGQPMGNEQIRGTIRRAYARAGIPSNITGTHILRHSIATSMYENGASLKVIADVLGHESIDTTVVYTKVDRSALYCVTCPWPEVDHD